MKRLHGSLNSNYRFWRWKKDRKSPDANTIIRLAKALKCTVSSLFGEEPEHEPSMDETLEAVRMLAQRGELNLEDVAHIILPSKKKRKNTKPC